MEGNDANGSRLGFTVLYFRGGAFAARDPWAHRWAGRLLRGPFMLRGRALQYGANEPSVKDAVHLPDGDARPERSGSRGVLVLSITARATSR